MNETWDTRRRQRPIRVLVVDDSAVVRQAVLAILKRSPDFAVTIAADAVLATGKIARDRPDVILLDLELPRMHGLDFLAKLMDEDPIPVVVCSGVATAGSTMAVRALEAGAVEIVAKPKLGVREFLEDSAVQLMDALTAAAQAKLIPRHRRAPAEKLTADAVLPRRRPRRGGGERIIAIGASTGGPAALRCVLETMPEDAPGIVIVQHMPEGFTAAFAARLDELCRIEVKEATDGDELHAGRALVAPGDRHMLLERGAGRYIVRVQGGPLVSRHRPSADVLFRSAAQTAGPDALGVIMTGMGDDGAQGLLEMKQAGAVTLVQDEESCVVFGMPHEAIVRGAADEVVALSQMSEVILRRASAPAQVGS